jgi:hypothetical protein
MSIIREYLEELNLRTDFNTLDDGEGPMSIGTRGLIGTIGPTGTIGCIGATGAMGPMGMRGLMGPPGPMGTISNTINVDVCRAGCVTISSDLFINDLSTTLSVSSIIKQLQDKIKELDKEIQIMRPIVKQQRDKSARLIQRAWHNYLYAPGRGKYYKMAHKDFNQSRSSLPNSGTSCHSSSLSI